MRAVGKEAGLKSFEQVSSQVLFSVHLQASAKVVLTLMSCSHVCTLQVKDLHLHPEMFSIANGLLTPTLKSRRTEIRKAFQEQLSSMYKKAK